jgi:UDP-3-O-[3-hydroxymyristoyl] glucosamine N-acyltransferase
VIFEDAKIDDFTIISGALIGEGAIIGKKVKIPQGCIIADQAKVKDGVSLSEKVTVCPAKEVSEDTLKLKSKSIC